MNVAYKPSFVRQFNALESALQEEVIEKIEQFKKRQNHKQLRVHKLKGRLTHCFSFSVNYRYRIIFEYESTDTAVLLGVGDHSIYD